MFSIDALLARLLWLPLWIISLSIHEFAHAWSAGRLGDDTAARSGRLTLNPIAHIDWIGTVLLPLMGVPFGWAKPVPVNPARFRREVSMGKGMALTAGAGPLSNLALATLAAGSLGLALRYAPGLVPYGSIGRGFLFALIQMNVGLAIFNLLPVPPLDGSRLVAWLMPYRLRDQWHQLEQFGPFLLIGVFVWGGRIVAGPIDHLTTLLFDLVRSIALA